MNGLLLGLEYFVSQPSLLLYLVGGMGVGLVFGSIPGLSASMAAVLLLPFTFSMDPIAAITLVTSMYAAGVFGGSITAILFNIPGTPEAACTTFDGHPMHRQGKGSLALGAAIMSSSIGGVFGALTVILLAPVLANWAIMFGPFEYFSLTLLGLVATANLGAKTATKGYLSSVLGVLLSTIGISTITSEARFTFGSSHLMAGVGFVPVMIGAFAMSEVIGHFWFRKETSFPAGDVQSKASFVFKELVVARWTIVRSAVLGVIVGIMPGAGSTMASFLAYFVESHSKGEKPLGTGQIRGVIAPETANNSAAMGTLVPMLALGLPGGAVAAIMYGIFQMHNLQPGPLFFLQNQASVYPIFTSLLIANILIAPLGMLVATNAAKLTRIPKNILFAIVFALSVIGAFAVHNNIFDVLIMVGSGFLGIFMKRFGFSVAAMVLGLILGPILEESLIRTMLSGETFFYQPIGMFFLIMTALFILVPVGRSWAKRKVESRLEPKASGG